jgi:hypothetical protein
MDFKDEILAFLKTVSNNEIVVESSCSSDVSFGIIKISSLKEIHLIKVTSNSLDFYQKSNPRAICIWEDVWNAKKEIIKSRLKYFIGASYSIPARVCEVKNIDGPTCNDFLEKNHLQGGTGAKFKYGLYLKPSYSRLLDIEHKVEFEKKQELLLAVMTFSSFKNYYRADDVFKSTEMVRYASLLNINVVGGLNKLMSAFIKTHNPDDIMTYADFDWTDGSNYENLGFKFIEKTSPLYFKIIDGKRLLVDSINEANVKNSGSLKYILYLKK